VPQKIQVGRLFFDPVFSFLDDHYFVVPYVPPKHLSEIVLNVHRLYHHHSYPRGPQQRQPQESPPIVRRYVLSVAAHALNGVRAVRFFPDVSACGGASPGHFYADVSKRVFGFQFEARSLKTGGGNTVLELLIPLRALMDPEQSLPPPYRLARVVDHLYLGWRLAYASRVGERIGTGADSVPAEKLPLALRGATASRLRFAVCGGALLGFEVRRDRGYLLGKGELDR